MHFSGANSCYEDLRNAIISRAADDYVDSRIYLLKTDSVPVPKEGERVNENQFNVAKRNRRSGKISKEEFAKIEEMRKLTVVENTRKKKYEILGESLHWFASVNEGNMNVEIKFMNVIKILEDRVQERLLEESELDPE